MLSADIPTQQYHNNVTLHVVAKSVPTIVFLPVTC